MSPSKADTPASLPSHLPGTTNLHNFLVSTVVSNPRSRSCSQPFLIESPGHTPTTFSTDFPTVFATVFPTMFPNDYRLFSRPLSRLCSRLHSRLRTRPISRPVSDRFHDFVPSRPTKTSWIPVPSRQPNGFPPSRPIPVPR